MTITPDLILSAFPVERVYLGSLNDSQWGYI